MSRLFAAAAACCCLCLFGCGGDGPELGSVSGQVTMDGKPLPNVLVTFVPDGGGGVSTGKTDANGKYELGFYERAGALIGKHKVSVTTLQELQDTASELPSSDPAYEKQAMGSASDYAKGGVVERIPARYNSLTEIVKEVTSGSNVINLELKSS